MSLSNQPYKGTRDFFPQQKRIQDFLFSKMRKTAERFGYEAYDGPMIEDVELYMAKSGEELINEQIYSFHDRGNRFVAIRPEMTPTLARMVSQIYRETPRPLRWYSIPNLWRYEKPQKGRLREHWQFNVDYFGDLTPEVELEVVYVIIKFLESFGANENHFKIHVNHRKLVDKYFNEVLGLGPEQSHKAYKLLDGFYKMGKEQFIAKAQALGLTDSQVQGLVNYLECNDFNKIASLMNHDYFEEFRKLAGEGCLNVLKYICFDPAIVRGLDYYTGLVFEVYDQHPENRRAIAGGGAYENLLQIFNEGPLPGIGFGMGDVTLKDFLTIHKLLPDLNTANIDFILSYQGETAKEFAMGVWKQLLEIDGCSVFFIPYETKFKKAFQLAEKKGASYIALIGDDEVRNGTVAIKNLSTKEQTNFEVTKLHLSIVSLLAKK
jgi:histidyl-tRNA synthetase